MNTNKFIAAFLPLVFASLNAATQIYICGESIDLTTFKFVTIGLFIFGIIVYTYKYNLVLFVMTEVPVMMLGIYLTSPSRTQIEIITLLRGVL